VKRRDMIEAKIEAGPGHAARGSSGMISGGHQNHHLHKRLSYGERWCSLSNLIVVKKGICDMSQKDRQIYYLSLQEKRHVHFLGGCSRYF
jgi:hypothetical protein